ncbi:nuclear receptor 2C2-associated protein isoform 2-T2 [Mantella aurantiaca]
MVASVICADTVSRVSSVLQRDVKQFGKKFLFDHRDETCWNSDQGSSQWIIIEFPQMVNVSEIHIQFQGGFSSRNCILEECCVEKLRLSFPSSTDFFGRIIVYHLDVLGHKP